MSAQQLAQTEDYFDALEKAVRETTRGNSFLNEFARRVRANDTDRVLSAIDMLKGSLTETISSTSMDVLRRELETMAASIAQTRKEIASIKPEGPGNNRIVTATEELDHVVKSTEKATSEILSAAERILEIVAELKKKGVEDPLCDELDMQGTNLMMACSFQDLTGQRMSKVVNTLRYVETRVNAMIEIWGITHDEADKIVAKHIESRPDGHLLNGPARDGEGVAQDDIDKLLETAGDMPHVEPVSAQAPTPRAAQPAAPVAEAAEPSMPAGAASQDDIDALFK